MKKALSSEIKVGIFVSIGLALVMVAILVLGSTENMLQRKTRYLIHFPNVEGLISGAKVVLAGVQVGTVEDVDFDSQRRDVVTKIAVVDSATAWVRKDSVASIETQGVLGDKYVVITAGATDQPTLPPGSEIEPKASEGLSQFISKGDRLMESLQSIASGLDHLIKKFDAHNRSEAFFDGMAATAKNLSTASDKLNRELDDIHLRQVSRNLNAILEKVNNGTGTLGALINDPGLYDDARALMGGANRNRVLRNLVRQAVKQGEQSGGAAKQ
jgi:phospholipid/cholesterol/gamma-HCH transport system substrate-binding protein